MQIPSGKAIHVDGIVQGVGFRPFVHNLAVRMGLTGDVYNSSRGVFIRIFGPAKGLEGFVNELRRTPPPLAAVNSINIEELTESPPSEFSILPSVTEPARSVSITPDAKVCADCRRELLEPSDRRYRYPFINCTHCGPRYTIINDVPYDRAQTTMNDFTMCSLCQGEYDNPADRRYHAQPNCCAECGPQLELLDENGGRIDGDPIAITVEKLLAGEILAIKGLGGFHLACDASNEEAVSRLRQKKNREEKPFAVMVKDIALARELIELPGYSEDILNSPAAPILIGKRQKNAGLAPAVAPVNDYYGVMLPYTPLHILLFETGLEALVMTSANRIDEPIVIANDEALERLSGIAEAYLMHNRRIRLRADDSVVMASLPAPTIVRRARGFVPIGIETGRNVDGIAGFGPMLKNTLAIGRGTEIFSSQHIGDLNNRLALDMFHEVFAHLKGVLGVEVHTIACDLHPDYPTTHLAEASGLPVIKVQHHHAHLVALMSEKRVYERSIGFSFDGTGYGEDGAIWGGEVFLFTPEAYQRRYHLEYVPLPGGDKAATEPWRMAMAYLQVNGIPYEKYVAAESAREIAALLQSKVSLYQTSSMGRLFDAVSSLCGICQATTYDGKAAMALEGIAVDSGDNYDFQLSDGIIKTSDLIRGVVHDLDHEVTRKIISGRFHNTIVEIIVACARQLRAEAGIDRVFLSGGVLMNSYLSAKARERLREEGFEVFLHTLLPPNDGGVAVGQVLSASCR